MNLKEASQWAIRQPDGISCGAACSLMAAQITLARNNGETNLTALMVREMMGTNPNTGTTNVEMRKAMVAWGMRGVRKLPSDEVNGDERLGQLKEHLQDGGMAMLRLMKYGCRHWNLAVGYDNGFVLLEPGMGRAEMATDEQVASWMAPRGWESWQLKSDTPCRSLVMRHIEEPGSFSLRRATIELTERIFTSHTGKGLNYENYLNHCTDWGISIALTDGDRLLGAYLLKEFNHHDDDYTWEPESKEGKKEVSIMKGAMGRLQARYAGLRGVQGVSLVVPSNLRGAGYGHLLRCMPGELGYQWSYGMQLKSLNNLTQWQKVRDYTDETPGCWITAGRVNRLRPMTIADMSVATNAEYSGQSKTPVRKI